MSVAEYIKSNISLRCSLLCFVELVAGSRSLHKMTATWTLPTRKLATATLCVCGAVPLKSKALLKRS